MAKLIFGSWLTSAIFYLTFCCYLAILKKYGLCDQIFQGVNFNESSSEEDVMNETEATSAGDSDVGTLNVMLKMATPCSTPNDDNGYCIEIQKCRKLYAQLNNTEARDFLKKSRCGPQNEDSHSPKVCCGKYNNYINRSKNPNKHNPLPKKCGHQNITMANRIFGGENTNPGEFPWMARLIHKNMKYGFTSYGCSGFLIHSKYVLTAAHCIVSKVYESQGDLFEVELGSYFSNGSCGCSEKSTRSRISDIIIHPEYNATSRNHHNDIGLIHLKKGARISQYIYPICLNANPNYRPAEYVLSGWGKTEFSDSSFAKLKVSVPHFNWNDCVQRYERLAVVINRSQICAGGNQNKDSCTGDSGGPLMMVDSDHRWFAVGIVSFGLDCGREGWPGIYTNITNYNEWIIKKINFYSNKSKNM